MDKDNQAQSNQINEAEEFAEEKQINQQGGANKQSSCKYQKAEMTEQNKLHFKPSNWKEYFEDLFYLEDGTSVFKAGNQGAIFLCIHGSGRSAMSFSCLAKEVKKFATLIAFDFKAHGESKSQRNAQDQSIEALVDEAKLVFTKVAQKFPEQNIILIGHQLGGSVAARLTDIIANKENNPRLVGSIIIDVVEGTSIDGLQSFNQFLTTRPKHFDSLEEAIQWSYKSGLIRNLQSARISIPSQLKQKQYEGKPTFVWKIKVKRAQKYWKDWFKGLSKIFLSIKIPKILVTIENQKLDQQLTIAQMQGKFKLTVINGVGHQVQEDDHRGVARILHDFIKDFRIPTTVAQSKQKQQKGIAHFHPHLNNYQAHK